MKSNCLGDNNEIRIVCLEINRLFDNVTIRKIFYCGPKNIIN